MTDEAPAPAAGACLRFGACVLTDQPPPWLALTDLLCGDMTGRELLAALRERFPHVKRDDCFRAIATAWTYHSAGWLAESIELAEAERKLAVAEAEIERLRKAVFAAKTGVTA